MKEMSFEQLSDFFDRCRSGTKILLWVKRKNPSIEIFSSDDSINETVWLFNPPRSLFRTRAVRLNSIRSAELYADNKDNISP